MQYNICLGPVFEDPYTFVKKKRKEIKSVSCLDIYYITSLVSIEDSEDEDYGNLSNDETSGKIGRIINPRCPF